MVTVFDDGKMEVFFFFNRNGKLVEKARRSVKLYQSGSSQRSRICKRFITRNWLKRGGGGWLGMSEVHRQV